MTRKRIIPASLLQHFCLNKLKRHSRIKLPTGVVNAFALILLCPIASAQADQVAGNFSSGPNALADWQEKPFKNHTLYRIEEIEGSTVLKAISMDSASGLLKKQSIDLSKTPFLNWRWRIENRLQTVNEQSKTGDDFAARIYVVVNDPLRFWRTQALNYVWAQSTDKGQTRANPHAGRNSVMLALRSSTDPIRTWQVEKRNLLDDLKQFTGLDTTQIDAIAIMTDTDNNHGAAVAYYGDIYFSTQ